MGTVDFTTVPCLDGEVAVLTKTNYHALLPIPYPHTSVVPVGASCFVRRPGFCIHYKTSDPGILKDCHNAVADAVRRLGFHPLCDLVDAAQFPWPEEPSNLQQHVRDFGDEAIEILASGVAFVQELSGRAVLLALSYSVYRLRWWAPLIAAPMFWQIWGIAFRGLSRIYSQILKLVADAVAFVVYGGYIAYSTVSFGLHIGHWYGWMIGLTVGVVVAQVLGFLWPFRWHPEAMEGNL